MAAVWYLVCAFAALWIAARSVQPMSLRAGAAVLLLPLCFTGRALLTGRIYAPIDLAYQAEPVASLVERFGIERAANPALSDVQLLMIPWREAVRFALSRGEWPLWNPFIFCGDILAANAEPAPYHPTNLLSLLLPVSHSLTFAATMTFLLAALAMFLYLRDLQCDELIAVFGAAAWMCSSFLAFFIEYPIGNAALLLPLVFLGVRRILRGSSLVLLTALVLLHLAGHPETTVHIVGIGLLYAVAELLVQRPGQIGRIIARGVTAGLLSLLLSAFFLLPFLDALPQSRDFKSRALGYALPASPSVPWHEVGQRVWVHIIPFIYGDTTEELAVVPERYQLPHSGYAGSILFPLAILAVWRSPWKLRWFFAAIVPLGFLAASRAPGISDVLDNIPLFNIALNERLVFASAAALVILASVGLQRAGALGEGRRLAILCAAMAVGLAFLVAAHWNGMTGSGLSAQYLHAHTIRLIVPVALTGVGFVLSRVGAPIVLALLLVQRLSESGDTYPTLQAEAYYPPVPILQGFKPDPLFRTVGKGFTLVPNTSIHYRLEDPRGFHGMTHGRLYETFPLWCIEQPVWFNRVEDLSRPFLNFLNVRYALDASPSPPPPNWSVVGSSSSVRLLQNSQALPRALIPRRLRFHVASHAVVEEMAANSDFGAISWIETEASASGERDNAKGEVSIRRVGLAYELQTMMDSQGWVVVSETAWRGWRAESAGNELPVAFANHAFLGIRVPAGSSRIRLRYWPDSFTWGLAISALSAAALLMLHWKRRP